MCAWYNAEGVYLARRFQYYIVIERMKRGERTFREEYTTDNSEEKEFCRISWLSFRFHFFPKYLRAHISFAWGRGEGSQMTAKHSEMKRQTEIDRSWLTIYLFRVGNELKKCYHWLDSLQPCFERICLNTCCVLWDHLLNWPSHQTQKN